MLHINSKQRELYFSMENYFSLSSILNNCNYSRDAILFFEYILY